jgi:ribosomal protein S18 acetylase RimI-like enzyme
MPSLNLSADHQAALDRPIWSALTSAHQTFAEGTALARRYPATVAPFAAVSDHSDAAWSDLADLAKDDVVAILSQHPLDGVSGFDIRSTALVRQMVAASAVQEADDVAFETLAIGDVPAMLELTALTKPGPFLPRTHELGRYIGIRDGNRLAAMAGERMRLDGFTEISAVCVHPDYRGKSYAHALVKILMKAIANRGETSFLHVFDDNHGAIALYERLGFVSRTTLRFSALRRRSP